MPTGWEIDPVYSTAPRAHQVTETNVANRK